MLGMFVDDYDEDEMRAYRDKEFLEQGIEQTLQAAREAGVSEELIEAMRAKVQAAQQPAR